MPSLYRVLVVLGLGVTVLALVAPAQASSGTLVITSSTTLTEDHQGSIIVAADNITLDCAGHTVSGQGDGVGVEVGGLTGVTVKNCRVTEFTQGIMVAFSTRVTLSGNHAFANPGNGFYVVSSSENRLSANAASTNGVHGLHLDTTDRNLIETNVFSGNGTGVALTLANLNTLRNNSSMNNAGNGIVGSGVENTYEANKLVANGIAGLWLEDATAYVVAGNTSRANGWGMLVFRSDGGRIEGNLFDGNGGSGLALVEGSDSNLVKNNTARHSIGTGFEVVEGSNGNTLEGNASQANTERGFRLQGVSSNVLLKNTANGNDFEGFILLGSSENTLSGNQANNNGAPGVYAGFALLEDSSANLLTENTANRNGADGFVVDASDGNTLRLNIGNANGNIGFWARNGASFNVFDRNIGRQNAAFDGVDDQTGTGNVWTSNSFGTTQGI